MTELEGLKSSRRGLRSKITVAGKTLVSVASKKPLNKVRIQDAIDEFDRYLSSLDEVQTKIELDKGIGDMDKEVEDALEYRQKAREPRLAACEVLAQLEQESSQHRRDSKGSDSTPRLDVRLPKLVLPSFDGNVLEWQSWWDQFDVSVHKTELPVIQKFTYLKNLLEGEASEAIKGLSLTSNHYFDACTILFKRFGRKERIIFGHVQELLSLSVASGRQSLGSLRKLQDSLVSNVRSLEALGIDGQQYGVLLTPIVLTALPSDIRMQWARQSETKESDLAFLLDFMEKELSLRETTLQFKKEPKYEDRKPKHADKKKSPSPSSTPPTPTSASLTSVSAGSKKGTESKVPPPSRSTPYKKSSRKCLFCESSHWTTSCPQLLKLSVDDRQEKLRDKQICCRCLYRHDKSKSCQKHCVDCGGTHHRVLCPPSKVEEKHTKSHTGCSLAAKPDTNVVMQVLKLEVRGRNGIVEANVLFDSGADRTYVSSDIVKQIDPEFHRSERLAFCSFGNSQSSKEELRNVYSLELRGSKTGCGVISATEVPVVCAPLFRRQVPSEVLSQFGTVELVEDYSQSQHLNIDILIGMDNYWRFVRREVVQIHEDHPGLVALKTVFGWILSGSYGSGDADGPEQVVAHQLFCVQKFSDSDIRQLWDVELEPDHQPDEKVLESFQESIEFHQGRYSVSLPWKDKGQTPLLENNYNSAAKRLKSLSRKLDKEPALKEQYNGALQEMETNGVVEEVPEQELSTQNPVFYLPHRPIVKESSTSTKVRPVFDASAKGPNGLSLNDCMETGPNLLPNLVEILLRYRRWPVALVADIQKAFLQISVRPEDRDVHRFLWELDGVIRTMRLARVPFGNRSSPFILNATIKFHLNKFEKDVVTEELDENLYVDDWLSGADGEEEATSMVEEASDIMSSCSMNLTKWGSNKKVVLDQGLYNLSDKSEHQSNFKVLGLGWNPEKDCFMFEGLTLEQGLVITKRVVLSLIARLYDPLGFLTPFIIKLKCLFQDLWRLGVEWDSEVPAEHGAIATSWIEDLCLLKNWNIPRPYSLGPWGDIVGLQLHAFGDASETGLWGLCISCCSPRRQFYHV